MPSDDLRLDSVPPAAARWSKREMKELPEHLGIDELVEDAVACCLEEFGLLVRTDLRLFFLDKQMFGAVVVLEFPFSEVTSVECEPGKTLSSLTVVRSGEATTFTGLDRDRCRAFADATRARIAAPAPAAGGPTPAAGPDPIGDLERLSALWKSGALTDQEFEVLKQRVLGSVA